MAEVNPIIETEVEIQFSDETDPVYIGNPILELEIEISMLDDVAGNDNAVENWDDPQAIWDASVWGA